MRIIYMGTPDFAVPALQALKAAGHELCFAVSQPDKPKGRHGLLQPTPVKAAAEALGISVLQPRRADEAAFLQAVREASPDVIVVAAYGQLLKPALLQLPKYGCINIHASLLPRWRGAAPIQRAVMAGDAFAGVTTMQMAEGLDTGDILLQERIPLAPDETGGSLFEKLAVLGGQLILKTLDACAAGTLQPEPQPAAGVTYAAKLEKADGLLDFSKPASVLSAEIRGLSPWPGAYAYLNGKLLKIHKASRVAAGVQQDITSGTLQIFEDGRLIVCCGEDALELLEVQLEGKKRMQTAEFLRGYERVLREAGKLCSDRL